MRYRTVANLHDLAASAPRTKVFLSDIQAEPLAGAGDVYQVVESECTPTRVMVVNVSEWGRILGVPVIVDASVPRDQVRVLDRRGNVVGVIHGIEAPKP